MNTDRNEAVSERRALRRELFAWTRDLTIALVAVILAQAFLFTIIRVDGSSMDPTLHHDERLFVNVAAARLGRIRRGDVVICRYPGRGSTLFVKRVVGVPGDTVRRASGVTYVNGEPLDPMGLASQIRYDYDEYTLGGNEYFCVGDNRYNSHDSRDWNDADSSGDVGPIDGSLLRGRVEFVFWPLNGMRAVK